MHGNIVDIEETTAYWSLGGTLLGFYINLLFYRLSLFLYDLLNSLLDNLVNLGLGSLLNLGLGLDGLCKFDRLFFSLLCGLLCRKRSLSLLDAIVTRKTEQRIYIEGIIKGVAHILVRSHNCGGYDHGSNNRYSLLDFGLYPILYCFVCLSLGLLNCGYYHLLNYWIFSMLRCIVEQFIIYATQLLECHISLYAWHIATLVPLLDHACEA